MCGSDSRQRPRLRRLRQRRVVRGVCKAGTSRFIQVKRRTPVLQHVLHTYKMNLGFAKRLVGDVSADQMCAQPHGVVNHPAWSLGGLSSDLPAGWEDTWKPGSTPSPDKGRYPSKDDLLRVMEQQHARVAKALADADPTALAQPLSDEKMRAFFPTVGDFAVFLMTAHEMDHLGQIAAWRRTMGLGPAK
ncbi:MAG: DinB family protein [Verrucomicrobia bacterium]|nr:MAG: DinB family protein [Verrucomicrobiota bacterium]